LLANEIWRDFLLLSWRGSDQTGLKRRKDATSHIILDNLFSYPYRTKYRHIRWGNRRYVNILKMEKSWISLW
jgi:hypothetical protein